MRISLDEIENWRDFEDLIAQYFRGVANIKENSLTSVYVEPSGDGSDGGRDILLTFKIMDSIVAYERKWVVQCKFYSKALNLTNISSVNIPTLIHSYNADGYLLVCKNGVTSKVSELFEDLNKNCRFNYKYQIWTGVETLFKIKHDQKIVEHFFPEYHSFLQQQLSK